MRRVTIAMLLFTLSALAAQPRGWLGFGYNYVRQPDGSGWLHVQNIAPGGPAAVGGLQPYDIVLEINGKRMTYATDVALVEALTGFAPGQKLRLKVVRRERTLFLTVVSAPMPAEYAARFPMSLELARRRDAERARAAQHR